MNSFFKKHWYLLSVILILLLAAFLRFYKLGIVPHGMFWDEAAVGYNGYSVLTTRRDEWLERLPVSFQSFGDYKAPLGIYINGIFTYLFGMNLWAVRLPFALISLIGIFGLMLLAGEVFKENKYRKYYSLFAGFVATLSPWHFHYSRTGFDNGIALTLIIWGLLFFVKAIKSDFKNYWISFAMATSFSLSIYAYHSSKVVTPLLLISITILFFKKIWKYKQRILLPIIVFVGLLIPFLKDVFLGEGLTRANVTIFSSQLPFGEKIFYVFKSYAAHLSPNFLLLGETTTLRHGTGYLGVLFITTLLLSILGIFSLFKKQKKSIENMDDHKFHKLFFGLLVLGLLPACIALEVPHSSRSSLAFPGFLFLSLYGLDFLILKLKLTKINEQVLGSHGEKNIILKSVIGIILLTHIFLSISFLNHYFNVFSKESADAFKDGYVEAFEIAKKYEKGDGVEGVDKIIFTSDYGQPYIYALFVRKTNPIWYRGGSLIKYEFYDDINIGDLSRSNALVVGSNTDDLPIEKANHIIYGSDGEMRFQIYRTEKKEQE
jgi:hypothetical protein